MITENVSQAKITQFLSLNTTGAVINCRIACDLSSMNNYLFNHADLEYAIPSPPLTIW